MYNLHHLLGALSLFSLSANGLRIPIHRRDAESAHSTSVRFNATNKSGGSFNFTNVRDNLYAGTLIVEGQPFTVQLDTGSSDLWLDTSNVTLQGTTNTNVHGEISYLDTSAAEGPILLGEVSFGNFTVAKQAFISAPGSNATSGGEIQGLLGIGQPSTSNVAIALQNSSFDGSAFLVEVFKTYPDDPNFISFALSRDPLGTTSGGLFTIAEIPEEFSAITEAPHLLVNASAGHINSSEWSTLLDGVVINGNFGQGLSMASDLAKTTQTRAILDSGTSLALGIPTYVDAMYKNIPGANFTTIGGSGAYSIPCDAYVNISFVFGGLEYPVNPIDTSIIQLDDNGVLGCVGAFLYAPNNTEFDFLLGDTFLRNVYATFNFGDWVPTGSGTPFMQLLSVTDAEKAAKEFPVIAAVRQRILSMVDSHNSSSSSSSPSPSPSSSTQNQNAIVQDDAVSSASPSPFSQTVDLTPLEHDFDIVEGLLGGVILILLGILVMMIVRGRANKNRDYRPIQHPVSVPAFARDDEGQLKYSTPYD